MAGKITFTHKGWFGICPVYIADIDTDCPDLIERHWSLVILFIFSLSCYGLLIFIIELLNDEYEPMWPIKVTGKISMRKL